MLIATKNLKSFRMWMMLIEMEESERGYILRETWRKHLKGKIRKKLVV